MFKIGHGYDVHRLVKGRKLILCGEEISYSKGLLGHSDADVATHAVMDALLGAASLGDIGLLFPDSDKNYHNADSLQLLKIVGDKVEKLGFEISNVDITIIMQQPKLRPYINKMEDNIGRVLKLDKSQVNVKATTEEGLGFTGKGKGVASICTALIYMP